MKFSIVITTYNRVDFLQRAIASCQHQTVPCEIVVVDDQSADGTEAYVQSLGNQVVYHRNSQNLGHSGSVNAGVAVATGDWIKFLDDDDYLAPTCLAEMQRAIALHPAAVMCSCQAIKVDETGKELCRTWRVGPGQAFFVPQEAIHYGMLVEQIPFGTPVQVAVRRDAFLQTGGWDTTMTTNYDDIDAWVRVVEHGDAILLNQHLVYRTLWSGGFEQRKSLAFRLDLHIQIKERILKRVSAAYRAQCPSSTTLQNYLRLHWAVVALRQHQWFTAGKLGFPAVFSLPAWWQLMQSKYARQFPEGSSAVPKRVLY